VSQQPLYDGKIYQNHGNPSLLRLVPATTATVLDVGCGAGDNARILQRTGMKVWGATASESEAEIARQFCEKVWVGDIESAALPFETAFFDTLILSHVLEHFVRPDIVLTKLTPYLKPGGVIVAAVPNMANFRCRWRLLKGDWRRDDGGPFDRTHYHFWSYQTFVPLFKTANLSILQVDPGHTHVPLWPVRRFVGKFADVLDQSIGRRFPNLFSEQVLVVARPMQ
jgi:SAM-dependent methyltransferase